MTQTLNSRPFHFLSAKMLVWKMWQRSKSERFKASGDRMPLTPCKWKGGTCQGNGDIRPTTARDQLLPTTHEFRKRIWAQENSSPVMPEAEGQPHRTRLLCYTTEIVSAAVSHDTCDNLCQRQQGTKRVTHTNSTGLCWSDGHTYFWCWWKFPSLLLLKIRLMLVFCFVVLFCCLLLLVFIKKEVDREAIWYGGVRDRAWFQAGLCPASVYKLTQSGSLSGPPFNH